MQKTVDLHVHSTESDGTLTPEEVVRAAREAGLAAIALTDHDTVSGVNAAAATAKRFDVELIPGVELSTEYELPAAGKRHKEVHIIGLFVEPDSPVLLQKTKEFRDCRDARNEEMVAALRKEGFDITMEALYAENPDCVVTRANIARFLFQHGCIASVQEAFNKYIGDGCRCYVGRFKVTPMAAVELIHEAGGLAVLAHPILYHLNMDVLQKLIDDLKDVGLDAVEAIYSTYTPGEERLIRELAVKNDLLISGGSDFHGENKPTIRIGTGKGKLCVPYEVLEALKKRVGGR